jgi:predicted ATP-grasp superfamily ATP-dependent carboligase
MSALRRLKEANKTIYMLGGERESPPMVLAQRDMIKHEVDYYEDESIKLAFMVGFVAIFSAIVYTILVLKGWV